MYGWDKRKSRKQIRQRTNMQKWVRKNAKKRDRSKPDSTANTHGILELRQ
jgi:hypothetical protein